MASEMACSSASPSELPTNACERRKRAASAASMRCLSVWGSPSRSTASNSRCQCGYFMLWVVGIFCSVTTANECSPSSTWRARCDNSFNCILVRSLTEYRELGRAAIRSALVAEFHQSGAYKPGVVSVLHRNSNGCCDIASDIPILKKAKAEYVRL